MTLVIAELNSSIAETRRQLKSVGVPMKLLDSIKTRSYLSGRRTTGEFQSNRKSRWKLDKADPQFGSEVHCKQIYMILIHDLLCFDNAPEVPDRVHQVMREAVGDYVGAIESGSYRDLLTLEHINFLDVERRSTSETTHGESPIHIGHTDPSLQPKHVPGNVQFRTKRSNLIQGDLTLSDSRAEMLKLLARYLELGEVSIVRQAPNE